MLEKRNGHLVSAMDSRDNSSLNLHPKETDDILTEYNTLFSLSANPYYPAASILRCPEGLLEGGTGQKIPTYLPYLWEASRRDSQPEEPVGPRLGLWADTALDTLPLPEDRLSPLSKDSHRRAGPFRPLTAGDQEIGALYLRSLQDYDRPGGGSPSGPRLENSQGVRSEVPGKRLRDNRLSGASYPGHRQGLNPKRPPLPDGGPPLRNRTSDLGGQRPKSPDPRETCQYKYNSDLRP